MAESYLRATRNEALSEEMKQFAKSFHKKATDMMNAEEQG